MRHDTRTEKAHAREATGCRPASRPGVWCVPSGRSTLAARALIVLCGCGPPSSILAGPDIEYSPVLNGALLPSDGESSAPGNNASLEMSESDSAQG